MFGLEPITPGNGDPLTDANLPNPIRDYGPSITQVADSMLGSSNPYDPSIVRNFIANNITGDNGAPLSTRNHFLNLLDQWQFSLPLNQLWMVFFNVPRLVSNEAITTWGERIIPVQDDKGSINLAREHLLKPGYMRTIGCAFAQTVSIPQEQNAINKIGPTNRGFLKAPILEQRQQFASLNIEFLETSLSFVDFLIRPWVVISSHMGYVARPGQINNGLTTDMYIINFAKAGADFEYSPFVPARDNGSLSDDVNVKNTRGFVARKMYHFTGCSPINISRERYGYSPEGQVDRRDSEWVFKRYDVVTPHGWDELMNGYERTDQKRHQEFWQEHKKRLQTQNNKTYTANETKGFSQYLDATQASRNIQDQYIEEETVGRQNVRLRTGTRPGGGFDILSFLGF